MPFTSQQTTNQANRLSLCFLHKFSILKQENMAANGIKIHRISGRKITRLNRDVVAPK